MRLALRSLTCVALLLLTSAGPASAADEELDRATMKSLLAMCEEFALGDGDGGRLLVMAEAERLPPIPASAVEELRTSILGLRKKHGPKLKKRGKAYFYEDGDEETGLYLVSGGKKGGGLLLSLHGGGEGQGSAGSAHGVWSSATSKGFTVISPEVMRKVSSAWNEQTEEYFVLELIDAAKRTFGVDPDRICIAGHSMGGDGSWMIGGRNADMFAAASPLAGSVMPYMRPGTLNRIDTPLADYQGLMEGVLPNLMHLPTTSRRAT
jgi:acetyl esterase/lipase